MESDRRSIAPLIGIILVVFGGALLLQAAYPAAEWPRTAFAVVISLVSASVWAVTLYVGTILSLLALPGLLGLGIWLLIVAVRRAFTGGGFGWEAPTGAVLILMGWSCVLEPPVGPPFLPVVLLTLGAGLLARRQFQAMDGSDRSPADIAGDRRAG